MQKFGSTRNKIGFKYSRNWKELYVREVLVSKFHTSVVTLKIKAKLGLMTINTALCWHFRNKADENLQIILSQFTNLPVAY